MTAAEVMPTHILYEQFRTLILEKTGLFYPDEKRADLARKLTRAFQNTGLPTLNEYYGRLSVNPTSSPTWEALIRELTVGETYFFRNRGHFTALMADVLGPSIEQRRNTDRRLRIWSAGCSTGEEPYSIAIALREMIPDIDRWNVLILATDINRDSLQIAREARYRSWSFRGVENRILSSYFVEQDGWYTLHDSIRQMVRFEYLNLIEDHYPSLTNNTHGMDVIFCRNVTIYFSPEVTRMVIDRFHQALVPDGWLFPGSSEPNLVTYQSFEPRNFPDAVVYRKSSRPRPPSVFTLAAEQVGRQPSLSVNATPSAPQPSPVRSLSAMPQSWAASAPAQPEPRPAPRPVTPALADPYEEAQALANAGKKEQAIAKLGQKLLASPNHAPTLRLMARLHADAGRMDEAETWCHKAITQDKLEIEPYFILSMISQRRGQVEEAIEMLRKLLFLDSGCILGHYTLGNLLIQQGKGQQAARSLRNAQNLLAQMPKDELVPFADGLPAGNLTNLVETALSQIEALVGSRT